MQSHIPNHTIRQLLLLLIVIGLGGVLFWNLRSFLPALLGAYTLYILLRKYLGIEINDEYYQLALSRVKDLKLNNTQLTLL